MVICHLGKDIQIAVRLCFGPRKSKLFVTSDCMHKGEEAGLVWFNVDLCEEFIASDKITDIQEKIDFTQLSIKTTLSCAQATTVPCV